MELNCYKVIALFENDKSTNMQREYYKNNKNNLFYF